MPHLLLGSRGLSRAALALAYVALLSLAIVALIDVGRILMPAAVPVIGPGPNGGWREPAVVEPITPAAAILNRWLDLTGPTGLRILLEAVIPGLAPSIPAARSGAGVVVGVGESAFASGLTYPNLLAYALRELTAVSIQDPSTLLAAQIQGLRHVSVASRSGIAIYPDRPGEGESATPPLPLGSALPSLPAADAPLRPAQTGLNPLTAPLIAIYQTHAMESYLPLVKQVSSHQQLARINAEEAFAEDPEITVVRFGQELAEILAGEYGLPTIHSRRFHDAAGRLGAYVQSAQTIERLLREYPTIRVLIDVHRDSPRRAVTTATVNGDSAAKILLVVGTDARLTHPQWRLNHEFAQRLHAAMETLYPELSRGILVTQSRYNQHYLPHSTLVEFGGVDNTWDEVMVSVRMFATALVSVLSQDPSLASQLGWP